MLVSTLNPSEEDFATEKFCNLRNDFFASLLCLVMM